MIWVHPALGSPGIVAAGGVLRDCLGSALASFAVPFGIKFPYEAELLVMSIAVKKAYELHIFLIWIESDSTYVVNLIRKKSVAVP